MRKRATVARDLPRPPCTAGMQAGVIISTVPIGFVALTEYGFTKVRRFRSRARVGACARP